MDTRTRKSQSSSIRFSNILGLLAPSAAAPSSMEPQYETCHSRVQPPPGEFPLAFIPGLATCSFFRQPTNLIPEFELSICEVAALELCRKRGMFKQMKRKEGEELKERSGGSWKLVLMYLLAREASQGSEKLQVVAGGSHNIIVTGSGDVYTFGQIDGLPLSVYPATKDSSLLKKISSLEGVRIVQAAAAPGKTMLVSDSGLVYACGLDIAQKIQNEADMQSMLVVDSLKEIFVVQVVIGVLFVAVLSMEGRVYTIFWGDELKLGHQSDPMDMEPRPLNGALANIPVVQIGAGHCYLLALAFQPNGMSVYSVGCGEGGKLGHGSTTSEKLPRLIEHFQVLNVQPTSIFAGTWHAAVLGHNGEVCTWGWGHCGCLGHRNDAYQTLPMVVQGLGDGKAVHIATGNLTTFVVHDNGQIYYFGAERQEIPDAAPFEPQYTAKAVINPKLARYLMDMGEKIVQISIAKSAEEFDHLVVLTESGNVFALCMAVDDDEE
ncbi:hypothetical protein SAY86_008627 [Trapa natans]|uniref:Uncharacterized protein n=1 Tax=Trapa natans TaxID=22666 RepID=A0AAN7QBG8_TRANT|nr:hypothetical protein SAY86_008627 [Trapa natans]